MRVWPDGARTLRRHTPPVERRSVARASANAHKNGAAYVRLQPSGAQDDNGPTRKRTAHPRTTRCSLLLTGGTETSVIGQCRREFFVTTSHNVIIAWKMFGSFCFIKLLVRCANELVTVFAKRQRFNRIQRRNVI